MEWKGIQERTLIFLESHWKGSIFVGVVIVLVFGLAPVPFINRSRYWQNLANWATWFYAVTAFATLVAVLIAAILAVHQLLEISKSRQLQIVLELSKIDSTQEMYEALKAVHNYPPMSPEEFIEDSKRDFQRRLVSSFWEMVAWMVLEELADTNSKLLRSRYEYGINDLWMKLRPLEIAKRLEIERIEHPDWTEDERRAAAVHRVDEVLALGRLYKKMSEEAA
jgi:hypothetical protein